MLRLLRPLRVAFSLDTLALLFLAGLVTQTAAAQSLSFSNLTRPSQSDLWVGDTWLIQISGGAPNTTVTVCGVKNGVSYGCTPFGSTDGSGYFQISSSVSSGDTGAWTETWYVGATAASPSLAFNAYPGCSGGLSPYISNQFFTSYDYYYSGGLFSTPDFQSLGYGQAGASASGSSCTFYTWYETSSPTAISMSTIGLSSTGVDVQGQDSGGGFFGARDRSSSSYPLSDRDDFEFVFRDSGGFYFYSDDSFFLTVYRVDL